MLPPRRARRAALLFPVITLSLAACGSGGDGPTLSAAGEAGRTTMRTNGCASCHGADGQGGVGPTFQGLYGTEVELEDGTTVVADDDYLYRSITEPGAQIHAGYRVPMPPNNLSDAEIAGIIDYIREIGPDSQDDS